jgi:hypothetical protein
MPCAADGRPICRRAGIVDRHGKSDLVSGGDVGPGAKFVTVNRGKPCDPTIPTYERPGRFGNRRASRFCEAG